MEKLKKMIFKLNKECEYVEYLKCFTKDELDHIRKTLKVKGASKLKKEELAQVLSNSLQENIQAVLKEHITDEQNDLFNCVLNNQGVIDLSESNKEKALGLRSLGVVFFIEGENKPAIVIPKEIISILGKDTEQPEKTKVDTEVTDVTCGLLYFYGAMNGEELYKSTCSLIKNQVSYDEYEKSLKSLCEVEKKIKFVDGVYCNKGVMEVEKIKKALNERKDINSYKPSLQQVLECSSEDYILWNETIQNLYDIIKNNPKLRGEDDKELVGICINLIRNGFNFMEILTYLSQFIAFTSMEEGNKFIIAMQNLENNCRLWVLKGNTPEEVAVSKKQSLDATVNFHNSSKNKIGRNEPCICGSGKKYKKCCGKN